MCASVVSVWVCVHMRRFIFCNVGVPTTKLNEKHMGKNTVHNGGGLPWIYVVCSSYANVQFTYIYIIYLSCVYVYIYICIYISRYQCFVAANVVRKHCVVEQNQTQKCMCT